MRDAVVFLNGFCRFGTTVHPWLQASIFALDNKSASWVLAQGRAPSNWATMAGYYPPSPTPVRLVQDQETGILVSDGGCEGWVGEFVKGRAGVLFPISLEQARSLVTRIRTKEEEAERTYRAAEALYFDASMRAVAAAARYQY